MSSREKTYIALMCSLFLALTAVISVILYATRAMVVSTEVSSAQKQMSQLLAAVEYGFEPLDIFAVDWAEWDDSYAYLGGDMPEFVDVNIDDEWFRKVRMNYVGFFDVESLWPVHTCATVAPVQTTRGRAHAAGTQSF